MQSLGYNYRITDIQSALGISQLDKIDRFIQRRREIAKRYNYLFKNIEEIILPYEKPEVKSSWHLYVIRLRLDKLKANRKEIFDALRKEGIGVHVHYIPVYHHPYYRELGYQEDICPKAEKYYSEAITLPIFSRMGNSEIKCVVKSFNRIIKNFRK